MDIVMPKGVLGEEGSEADIPKQTKPKQKTDLCWKFLT